MCGDELASIVDAAPTDRSIDVRSEALMPI